MPKEFLDFDNDYNVIIVMLTLTIDVGYEYFKPSSLYFSGAEVLTLELKYPVLSKEAVVEKYRNMFTSHPNIKIAILGRVLETYFYAVYHYD